MVRTLKIGLLTLVAGWATGSAAETLRVYFRRGGDEYVDFLVGVGGAGGDAEALTAGLKPQPVAA